MTNLIISSFEQTVLLIYVLQDVIFRYEVWVILQYLRDVLCVNQLTQYLHLMVLLVEECSCKVNLKWKVILYQWIANFGDQILVDVIVKVCVGLWRLRDIWQSLNPIAVNDVIKREQYVCSARQSGRHL